MRAVVTDRDIETRILDAIPTAVRSAAPRLDFVYEPALASQTASRCPPPTSYAHRESAASFRPRRPCSGASPPRSVSPICDGPRRSLAHDLLAARSELREHVLGFARVSQLADAKDARHPHTPGPPLSSSSVLAQRAVTVLRHEANLENTYWAFARLSQLTLGRVIASTSSAYATLLLLM